MVIMEDVEVAAAAPRSLHSQNKIYIRIENLTNRCVDIIWINFTGECVQYQRLGYKSFVDINTYETHPWIAVDSERRDRMLIDKQFVYMPVSWREYFRIHCPHIPIDSIQLHFTPPRLLIAVTTPLYSLRYRTLLEVRSYLKTESDVDLLDLPKELRNDLKLLIRERHRLPFSN